MIDMINEKTLITSGGQGVFFEKTTPCTPEKTSYKSTLIKSFGRSGNPFSKGFLVVEDIKTIWSS